MAITYTEVCTTVKAAITATEATNAKWDTVGKNILAFYDSPDALKAVKAQFCADAIVPALARKHRDALELNIPRKGSKDDTEPAKNAEARAAKKDATATRDTMFMYALKKAWPEYGKSDDAAESEDTPDATDSDKIRKALTELIAKVQKKESLDFDSAAAVKNLQAALVSMNPKH